MRMYTELVLRCEIKKDTPENVLNLIRNMLDGGSRETNFDPIQLFGERGDRFLRSASYYHHPVNYGGLEESADFSGPQFFVRCDCKNYDNEIERFIVWLTPYIESDEGEFLGYK